MANAPIAFPDLLLRTIAQIEAEMNRQAVEAAREAMALMNLKTEDGWRIDVNGRRFVKEPTDPLPQTKPPKPKGGKRRR
jgi:hypothetical protein